MHLAHLEEEDAGTDKDQESNNPGRMEGVTEEFMVHLARAAKDTQVEEKCCYHCSSPEHFICNCLLIKTMRENAQFKRQGGDGIEEGSPDPSNNSQHTKELPDGGSQGIKSPQQTPFLNPDPFRCWHGVEKVARVRINGESYIALLDNGVQINTITSKYISDQSWQMGPITNLLGAKVTCVGLGNTYTRLLGYVVIQVQVDGVQCYDEDQIALVIPDVSNFAVRIPVILGTPTISCIVNVMREKEIDALAMPWASGRVAHLLSVHRMTAVKVGDSTMEEVVLVKGEQAYTGGGINVMAQALWNEDGSLPQGLTIQNTYTELRQGSNEAVVVVRNSMAYLQTLQKKTPVARAVTATPLPKSPVKAQLKEEGNEPQVPCAPKLTVSNGMENYLMNWI